MFDKEPIWTRRSALAFNEWALRFQENPDDFDDVLDDNGDIITDYGYRCAKYLEQILREMDKEGLLPTGKKEIKFEWSPYLKSN